MRSIKLLFGLSLVAFLVLLGLLLSQKGGFRGKKSSRSLVFYCAAGIKPPVEDAAREYANEYGVNINLQYGGSGTLLNNLRIASKGDIYLAADDSYIHIARKQGLLQESMPLAYLRPVLAVHKNNEKAIAGIQDLFRDDVRVAMANPDAAAVGKLTKIVLENTGYWDNLKNRIAVFKPTVTDVANDIKIGAVDVGIVWDATVNQYPEIVAKHVPVFDSSIRTITVGVLSSSKTPTEALRFMRYLGAKDKGLQHFERRGYTPVEGDVWEEKPRLLLYSGGVNRLAIEETIKKFETREGVEVTRVYNGCGILVSQMQAGGRPDAYFACDVSFMNAVDTLFNDATDVSQTAMVILTQKGNPHDIQTLRDLTSSGLKVGVANPEQSALGALTKRLLENVGLLDQVMRNVRSQTPTADLLVNQIRTGSLDAVIVYKANTSQVRDVLDIIRIDDDGALAVQPFAIGENSRHKFLTQRLLNAIMSNDSKAQFESIGFEWLAGDVRE